VTEAASRLLLIKPFAEADIAKGLRFRKPSHRRRNPEHKDK
jgi:hypothetical protein